MLSYSATIYSTAAQAVDGCWWKSNVSERRTPEKDVGHVTRQVLTNLALEAAFRWWAIGGVDSRGTIQAAEAAANFALVRFFSRAPDSLYFLD